MDETVLAEFAEASYSQKDSDNDAVRPVPSSGAAKTGSGIRRTERCNQEIAETESEQTPRLKRPN